MTDEQGIKILKNIDRQLISHIDISYNPRLTSAFYDVLNSILEDPGYLLERVELEGNNIGDKKLGDLVDAILVNKNITYLNVSRCAITDKGARALARLVQNLKYLRCLFAHFNRILGPGASEIADAIGESVSIQVLDLSFNAITQNMWYK